MLFMLLKVVSLSPMHKNVTKEIWALIQYKDDILPV